jgi:hypothetical protein
VEVDAIRQQHETAISKQKDAEKKNATAPMLLPVKGAPPNSSGTNKSREESKPRWRQTLDVVAILAGIGYAIVTYWSWRDLRQNFKVDQRAWSNIQRSPMLRAVRRGRSASLPETDLLSLFLQEHWKNSS